MTWHDLGPRRGAGYKEKGIHLDSPASFHSWQYFFSRATPRSGVLYLTRSKSFPYYLLLAIASLSLSLSTSFHLAPYFLEAVQGLFIVSRVLPLLLFFHSTAARFLLPFEGERDEKLIFQTAERERRTRPPLRRFINALAFEVGGGGVI